VQWVGTVHPGQATEYAQEAAEEGYDIVVAVGGDGTVNEVVNGLMRMPDDERPALGVIPIGSGNDFAHNVGLPDSPGECVRHLFNGDTRLIDVARITDGSGRTAYYGNTAHLGFGGAVAIATRKITLARGFWIYMLAVLQTIAVNHKSARLQFTLDGETMAEEMMMFIVANGPREGGGFHVAPGAEMDDGLLNYVFIRKVTRVMLLRLLPEVMNARHMRFPQVDGGTAKRITIESDRGLPIHTDGEIYGPWEADIRHVEVEILPASLRVVV
jgi:YegS/Rv2252/BmrU family lipid kinase